MAESRRMSIAELEAYKIDIQDIIAMSADNLAKHKELLESNYDDLSESDKSHKSSLHRIQCGLRLCKDLLVIVESQIEREQCDA